MLRALRRKKENRDLFTKNPDGGRNKPEKGGCCSGGKNVEFSSCPTKRRSFLSTAKVEREKGRSQYLPDLDRPLDGAGRAGHWGKKSVRAQQLCVLHLSIQGGETGACDRIARKSAEGMGRIF